jgi:hypothetical protein
VRLYDLHQQAALTSPGLWSAFTALANPLLKSRIKISFFSATARGGGVALMRHSLIRIWRMRFRQLLVLKTYFVHRSCWCRCQMVCTAGRLGSLRRHQAQVPQCTAGRSQGGYQTRG